MTDEELAEIRSRVEAATPGPWFISPYGSFEVWYREGGEDFMLLERVGNPEDAAFIAASRTAIPTLLAERATLREMLYTVARDYYDTLVSEYNRTRNRTIGAACELLGIPPFWVGDTDAQP